MKKIRENKRAVFGVSLALLIVMILSATYAWFTASDSVDNEFKTGGIPTDSVKVWEIFKKPTEWKPGETVQKDVGVTNLGKEAIFVRATFNEMLQKLKSDGTELTITELASVSTEPNMIPVPVTDMDGKAGWQEASAAGYTVKGLGTGDKLYVKKITNDTGEKLFYSAISSQNGAIAANYTVKGTEITASELNYRYYEKDKALTKNWTDVPLATTIETAQTEKLIKLNYHTANLTDTATSGAKWYYNQKDGWFYYLTPLKGGEITPFFLKNVTLDATANNSYQYLDFKLNVRTEGLQGTAAALAQWGITATTDKALYDALVKNITE